MATKTTKLGLIKPVESDYFNINDFNSNMDRIDECVHIFSSGNMLELYYGYNNMTSIMGHAEWHWKKYDDGTFTASTYIERSDWRCNDSWGEDGTYISGYIMVNYPNIGIKSIYNTQITARLNGRSNWAMDTGAANEISRTFIRLCGPQNEGVSEQILKRVYVQIEGMWK